MALGWFGVDLGEARLLLGGFRVDFEWVSIGCAAGLAAALGLL